jgi:hypothetical protein
VTQTISTLRTEILATSKPEYHGRDFFKKPDFRGLLLADFQNAIGEKALDSI